MFDFSYSNATREKVNLIADKMFLPIRMAYSINFQFSEWNDKQKPQQVHENSTT